MSDRITQSQVPDSRIPSWVVWTQCIAFVVLYAVWILPEIVGYRNSALTVGAVFGAYAIYEYRELFLKKSALPIWLIVTLFVWATLHLFFLSPNFSIQYIEYYRIWKYAAIGSAMAVGLGLSLVNSSAQQSKRYWPLIYFGLCTPVIIYIAKYLLSTYGEIFGVNVPPSLRIYDSAQPFYVPKTDYVAFCLPAFSIALGALIQLSDHKAPWRFRDYFLLMVQILIIGATLFLFAAQNIKNGMAYAAMLFIISGVIFLSRHFRRLTWKKMAGIALSFLILASAIAFNVKQNDSWRTLVADTKIGLQLEKYPHWRNASKYGHPLNEYGTTVSVTNYERAAWALVGLKLSLDEPVGYGLIEDSFAKMVKERWPDAGVNLSHSHSGWLDLILAVGYPGFLLIFFALLIVLCYTPLITKPWALLAFWPLLANLLLWCTTEVSATVTFAALLFWICLGSGLALANSRDVIGHSK